MLYRVTFTFIIILLVSFNSFANDAEKPAFKWQVGEELFYKVRYAFFTVGSLHFEVVEKDTFRNRPVYHCKMLMKSNPSIPFVPELESSYESLIDEDVYAHLFWSIEKHKDHYLHTRYDINYDTGIIHIRMEKQFPADTVVVIDSSAAVTEKVQDGLSLLYYARANNQKIGKKK